MLRERHALPDAAAQGAVAQQLLIKKETFQTRDDVRAVRVREEEHADQVRASCKRAQELWESELKQRRATQKERERMQNWFEQKHCGAATP